MEQVRDFSKRLHVPQSVVERALEYYRLSELQCSTVVQTSALALVCIEIACSQLGEPFEKVHLFVSFFNHIWKYVLIIHLTKM